jgi:hypothetical protein
MAEMERLKTDERMFKSFTTLHSSTKNTLEKAYNSFKAINKEFSEDVSK